MTEVVRPEDDPAPNPHWRKAYESHSATIDAEHRELFALANRMLGSAEAFGADAAAFNRAVGEFMLCLQRHFTHEEALMRQIGYPDTAAHIRLHRELLGRAVFLRQQLDDGVGRIEQWIDFLAHEVVAGHLAREDRKFFHLLDQPAANAQPDRAV